MVNLATKIIMEQVLSICPDVDSESFGTDDEGMILIFENEEIKRELTFAVPREGSKIFVVAEGPSFRKAGMIFRGDNVNDLTCWLKGDTDTVFE